MDLKTSYQQQVDKYASEVAALRRKNNGFITGELLSFGAILTFVVCYIAVDEGSSRWLLEAVLALIAYFNIRRLDDKNKEKIVHLSALLAVYQNEIRALEGDFSSFEMGNQYQNPQHAYSFDFDVFGRDSLFHRICRTITTGGSDALARNLSLQTPLKAEEIARRVALQRNLQPTSSRVSYGEWSSWLWERGIKSRCLMCQTPTTLTVFMSIWRQNQSEG